MRIVKHLTKVMSAVAMLVALAAPAFADGNFQNGGFEFDFSSWQFGDNGLQAYKPWTVGKDFGFGDPWSAKPIQGVNDALNGFDGEAGYQAYLFQDIQIPPEGGAIAYNDRIMYDSLGIVSSQPRIYELQLVDPMTGQLLQILHHQEVRLNGQTFTDLGWKKHLFDVSGYAGRIIRVNISLRIPETFTGPAQIEFDDFQLLPGGSVPPPMPIPQPGPGVYGCTGSEGTASAGQQVILLQPGEMPQTSSTDANGCYYFGMVRLDKPFDVMIRGFK